MYIKCILKNKEILSCLDLTFIGKHGCDGRLYVAANLYSKEDSVREEACSACRSLATQCSDASALESCLNHLFQVFHGSEGKLTVATHKMSVLQVCETFILQDTVERG
jgi:hypothetical protein